MNRPSLPPELSRDERLRLKSQSHHLEPVVLLGAKGLTDAVLKEIDRALTAHGLVKVRAPVMERQEREQMFSDIADRLGAARIQLIGRLIVLFRPAVDDPHPHASRAASPATLLRAARFGGQGRRGRGKALKR